MRSTLKFAPIIFLFAALPAFATLIDFTDVASPTLTGDGVTVDVTAENGSLTWQNFDGDPNNAPCDSALLACDFDGIGVNDDEVTFGTSSSAEAILLTFSTLVDITDVFLFDLFGVNDDAKGNPAEIAWIQFFGAGGTDLGAWSLTGTAAPGTLSGFASGSGLVAGVSSIRFYTDQVRNSDFAVAGIRFVSVPEPSTLALLGGGLLAFGMLGRRRRKHA